MNDTTKTASAMILLHPHRGKDYLLGFADSCEAVEWMTKLSTTRQRSKAAAKIVQELTDMLFLMPASHLDDGKVEIDGA